MKKLMLGLGLLLSAGLVNAQNGLESIIVEKYYVSNAVDAAGSVGTLPTKTYVLSVVVVVVGRIIELGCLVR